MVDNTQQFRDILMETMEKIRGLSPEEFEEACKSFGYEPVRKEPKIPNGPKMKFTPGDSVLGALRGYVGYGPGHR